MIYSRDESGHAPSPLGEAIRRYAKRGAVIGAVSVFVAMLILAVTVRILHLKANWWDAITLSVQFDWFLAVIAAGPGALVGSVIGALLALLGLRPKLRREPEQHPLD
jgi:hypothetical protein